MPAAESALVVLAPEAEPLVKAFRDAHDPVAAAGVPAHITLLYPFKHPAELGPGVLESLGKCFARFEPFKFSLVATGRFHPGVLYLVPEPDEPFRRLTRAIHALYPDTPPYGGKFSRIVPHLTIAQVDSEELIERIADRFAQEAKGKLPITVRAAQVALMDNRSGRWEIRALLGLGSPNHQECVHE
jgi:2'-5' RNA ligase